MQSIRPEYQEPLFEDPVAPEVAVLLAQKATIEVELQKLFAKERADALERVRVATAKYNFQIREVFPDASGRKAPIKFRDVKTGNEWSGRGKLPKWLVGKNRDDFSV
jgi:DNA-binding protein H-NS